MQQRTVMSSQEEHTEQNVSGEESECEYDSYYGTYYYHSEETGSEKDSDCEDSPKFKTKSKPETESKLDSELEDKLWRRDSTLRSLDSTLSESATGEIEGTGPFFWMAVSDVMRHCAKTRSGDGYESMREGMRRFRLNKTWKYWLCYKCDKTFIDPESHMVHLENEHQLCLSHDEYWLIPTQVSPGEVAEIRQDVVKSEPGLEDSITIDHTYGYFLVDSTKFYQMPSANIEEERSEAKRERYMEIVDDLRYQLSSLTCLFHLKRKYMTDLEIVHALHHMLFNGGHPLSLLVSWLHKLSILDRCVGTTHRLQFQLLSPLLYRAHGERYGLLSQKSVREAFPRHEAWTHF